MEICCLTVNGRSLDLAYFSLVTGRSIDRIVAVFSCDRSVRPVVLPDDVLEIEDIKMAKSYYRQSTKMRATFYLLRWLELCQTEQDLFDIQSEIPPSSELEILFLTRAATICG